MDHSKIRFFFYFYATIISLNFIIVLQMIVQKCLAIQYEQEIPNSSENIKRWITEMSLPKFLDNSLLWRLGAC